MTFIAEVRLSHPDLALVPTIEAVPDASVTVSYPTVAESGDPWLLFAVEGELEAFDDALAADPTVTDPLVVVGDANRRVYRVRLLTRTLLSSVTAELGLHVLELRSRRGAWLVKLQAGDREALVAFREYCTREGLTFETERLYTPTDGVAIDGFDAVGLTDKQHEALVAAYEAGYFATPRRTSLEGLAGELGVSSTAVSKRLRAGTARLVETTLGAGEPKAEDNQP